ncbi:PREDICTED: non-specific lipid-transfer protein 2-like [Nelumbo nucifera]|uniref:Non-specific lipid-transfer protein 2-like n=1 Tax=Nelumbo nucifera TaxID=4432 RepID=A0A1U8BQ14_NELNU|nr:PREDICTED: non-specific lipid-transfer protein 2-like [Nelumbo nucifera]
MKVAYITLCVVLVLLLNEAHISVAVVCRPTELASCASAITSSAAPSKMCCSKLKEQRPCLCKYLKDPNLQKLINTPNAKKVASTCGIPFPSC